MNGEISERTKFAWPVVVILASLAFGVGGAWVQIANHGSTIDKHQTKLDDHERRVTQAEDHYEAIRQWMESHK